MTPSYKDTICFRIPVPLQDQLRFIAQQRLMTLDALVVEVLEDYRLKC